MSMVLIMLENAPKIFSINVSFGLTVSAAAKSASSKVDAEFDNATIDTESGPLHRRTYAKGSHPKTLLYCLTNSSNMSFTLV